MRAEEKPYPSEVKQDDSYLDPTKTDAVTPKQQTRLSAAFLSLSRNAVQADSGMIKARTNFDRQWWEDNQGVDRGGRAAGLMWQQGPLCCGGIR